MEYNVVYLKPMKNCMHQNKNKNNERMRNLPNILQILQKKYWNLLRGLV